MATEFQQATTFGDEFVLEVSRQMLSFRNITKDVFEEALAAILDFSAATGRNATGAVRTLGLAINDPVAGLGRLSQAGVALTSTQKDLIKSMVESGDLLGAQRLLINELQKSYGGAAAAARDTLGGALESLGNAFGDLLEQDSLPGTKDEIEELIKLLQTRDVQVFANQVGELTAAFLSVTIQVGEFLSKISALFGFLGNIAPESINEIKEIDVELGVLQKRLEMIKAFSQGGFAGRVEFLQKFGLQGLLELASTRLKGGVDKALEELIQQADALDSRRAELLAALTGKPGGTGGLGTDGAGISDTTKNAIAGLTRQAEAQELLLKAQREGAGAVEWLNTELAVQGALLSAGLIDNTMGLREAMDLAVDSTNVAAHSIAQLVIREREAARATDDLAKSQLKAAEMADAVAEATGARGVAKAVEDAAASTNTLADNAARFGLVFNSAFEDAIVAGNGLSEAFQGIEQDIIRLITRMLILEPLLAGIRGGFEGAGLGGGGGGIESLVSGGIKGALGLFGGGGRGPIPFADALTFADELHRGGVVGQGAPQRLVDSRAFLNAPRMHRGGTVGLPILAGERAIVAKKGETVRTEEQERALRGGGRTKAPVVHVHVQGAPTDGRTRDQIAIAAARGIRKAQRRLGP